MMLDVAWKYLMKFNSKKSMTMMVGGKGSGGEWKINEEKMENVEVFKYLGVWFDGEKRGNVHLEKMREKEVWDARRVGSSRLVCNMEELRAGCSCGRMAGRSGREI